MTSTDADLGSVTNWMHAGPGPIDPALADAAGKSLNKMMDRVAAIATENLGRLRPELAFTGEDIARDSFVATFDRLKRGELDFRNRHVLFAWLCQDARWRSLNLVRDCHEVSLLVNDQDPDGGADPAQAVSYVETVADGATGEPDAELVMGDLLRRLFDSLDNTDTQQVLLLRLFSQLIMEDSLIELMSRPAGDDPLRQALNNLARKLNFPASTEHGTAFMTKHAPFSESTVFRNLERIQAKLAELLADEPADISRSDPGSGTAKTKSKQYVTAYLAKLKSIADGYDFSTSCGRDLH